jgi:hypothetical protein
VVIQANKDFSFMSRFRNLKIVTMLGFLSTTLVISQADYTVAQDTPPMTIIPITGGQFNVDLNIQNAQVQNYSYTNNQLPTLLTPVGTIGLTSAKVPSILMWQSPGSRLDQPTEVYENGKFGSEPQFVSTWLQANGNIQLNDGRYAKFQDSDVFLLGRATASSPISAKQLANATGLGAFEENSTLPDAYQGTINVNIYQGGLLVPQTAFSSASSDQSRLGIQAGKIEFDNNRARFPAASRQILLGTPEPPSINVEAASLMIYDVPEFGGINSKSIKLSSPEAELDLQFSNLNRIIYPPSVASLVQKYDGSMVRGETLTVTANGTVNLSGGQVVAVKNRLVTLNVGYQYNSVTQQFDTVVFGGNVYIDPVPSKQIVAIESTSNQQIVPITEPEAKIESEAKVATILTDTSIVDQVQNLTQLQIARPISNLPSQNTIADIMASPLSSSRIFPDMGALR